ncbi:unnamed protein product, partial [Owenia fusiformis]
VNVLYFIKYCSKWKDNCNETLKTTEQAIYLIGLVPFTNYTIEVTVRATYNGNVTGYPSDISVSSVTSMEDVPGGVPKIPRGAFWINNDVITIFWHPIEPKLRHGYVTYHAFMEEPEFSLPKTKTETSATFEYTNNDVTRYYVRSKTTSENMSLPIPYIDVHGKSIRPPHPSWNVSMDNGTVIFQWLNEGVEHSHTVFWCRRNPASLCQGELNSVEIPKGVNNFTMSNVPDPGTQLFGLSVENDLSSSGIEWAECSHNLNIQPTEAPNNFGFTEKQEPESLQVRWDPYTCDKYSGIVTGYDIRYCNQAECKVANVPFGLEFIYTIRQLEGGQGYNVTIRAVNNIGRSPNSKRITRIVASQRPKVIIVMIVLGCILLFVLVCLGIWQTIRWMENYAKRTKQNITIPEHANDRRDNVHHLVNTSSYVAYRNDSGYCTISVTGSYGSDPPLDMEPDVIIYKDVEKTTAGQSNGQNKSGIRHDVTFDDNTNSCLDDHPLHQENNTAPGGIATTRPLAPEGQTQVDVVPHRMQTVPMPGDYCATTTDVNTTSTLFDHAKDQDDNRNSREKSVEVDVGLPRMRIVPIYDDYCAIALHDNKSLFKNTERQRSNNNSEKFIAMKPPSIGESDDDQQNAVDLTAKDSGGVTTGLRVPRSPRSSVTSLPNFINAFNTDTPLQRLNENANSTVDANEQNGQQQQNGETNKALTGSSEQIVPHDKRVNTVCLTSPFMNETPQTIYGGNTSIGTAENFLTDKSSAKNSKLLESNGYLPHDCIPQNKDDEIPLAQDDEGYVSHALVQANNNITKEIGKERKCMVQRADSGYTEF